MTPPVGQLVPGTARHGPATEQYHHVVGLAHVNDPTQIMNHFVSVGTFGAGDMAGLARLGRAQGCFTPPKAPW